ncbi:MAG: response regulator [Flavobacteriales bacterium]
MDIINVVVIDNDKLVANLLADFINSKPQYDVVDVLYDGSQFIDQIKKYRAVDILIMDLKMVEVNGDDVLRYFQENDIHLKTVIISSHYKPQYLGHMYKLGASAFLAKEIEMEELIFALEQVHKAGHYLNSEQLEVLKHQLATNVPSLTLNKLNDITSREKDILKLLCKQMTSKEIGEELFISKRTVESHKSNLLIKTGAKNIAGLIIFATQHGLIDVNSIIVDEFL